MQVTRSVVAAEALAQRVEEAYDLAALEPMPNRQNNREDGL